MLCVLGALVDITALMQALTVAGLFWLALPLGAMAVRLAHGLTGGAWGRTMDAPTRALLGMLPAALLPLAAVLAAGPGHVFVWIDPPAELRHHLAGKSFYLDKDFLAVRFALYAIIWTGLAWTLGAWRPDARSGRRTGAAGAILWVLTVTFFAFDWVMSLDPMWYSDILGLVCIAGFTAPAMALALLLALRRSEPEKGPLRDFATLMLGVLLIWLFVSFVQFLIIWMANLPHEIGWYLDRDAHGWRAVTIATAVLFFAAPFLLLAKPAGRASPRMVRLAAIAVLLGHGLQSVWLVLPGLQPTGAALYWLTPAALLVVGGLAGLTSGLELTRAGRAEAAGGVSE